MVIQQPLINQMNLLRRRGGQLVGNRSLPGTQFQRKIIVGKAVLVVGPINPDHNLGQQRIGAESKYRRHELNMMTMIDLHHFKRRKSNQR